MKGLCVWLLVLVLFSVFYKDDRRYLGPQGPGWNEVRESFPGPLGPTGGPDD
jgi:hypothetical protein